jgi:hypothetical protein
MVANPAVTDLLREWPSLHVLNLDEVDKKFGGGVLQPFIPIVEALGDSPNFGDEAVLDGVWINYMGIAFVSAAINLAGSGIAGGGTQWRFKLPIPAINTDAFNDIIGTARVFDAGSPSGPSMVGVCQLSAVNPPDEFTIKMEKETSGGVLGNTASWAWNSGDSLTYNLMYWIAL